MTKVYALEDTQHVKESCALHENQIIITNLTRDLPRPVPSQMNSVEAVSSCLFTNQCYAVPTIYI